jgi:16S rRNA (adenine1518-N6/adenine1519-N6)-dimethyltransferase
MRAPELPQIARPPLRKALGQHHLIDGRLLGPLVEFLRPAVERVVEIGPGGGVLTGELLAAGAAKVVGLELDPAWAFALRRRLVDRRLAVAVGDALQLAWERLQLPTLVAGNLPYNVATAIIEDLLRHDDRVPRAAFLVQKEVAERIVARPGDPAYGSFSVLVAAYAEARVLGRVRPGSFRPAPKVESAFIGLTLHPPPLPPAEMPAFLTTVRLAFGQRRKTLRNALAAGWGRKAAEAALAAGGLPPTVRAENLGLDAFLAIHAARPQGAHVLDFIAT